MEVKGDVIPQSGLINDVDVRDIDARLVRNSIEDDDKQISGHKTFLNGFETFQLICEGNILIITSLKAATQVNIQFV